MTESSPAHETIVCPSCGERALRGKFCELCGKELPPENGAPVTSTMLCPNCGEQTPSGKFCAHCGKELTTDSDTAASCIVCPSCGKETLPGKYCEHCGQELPGRAVSEPALAITAGGTANLDSSETLVLRTDELKKIQTAVPAIQSHAVALRTDIGHKHQVNQDAGGAWTRVRPDGTPASLIVVADGVSAGRHSEGASKLVVDILEKRLAPLLEDPAQSVDALVEALLETAKVANYEVAQRPHHAISSADATTLVAALCVGDEGGGVWCGDSRVYHVAGQQITRLTRDHSWAEGVVSHGIMSAEDAARDPRAHMITRWLGPPEKDDPGVETFHLSLAPGDVVMCCTDGLYMYFAPPASEEVEMAQTLAAHAGNLQAGLDHLVEIALQRGGRDNVTAAAICSGAAVQQHHAESTTEIPVIKKRATGLHLAVTEAAYRTVGGKGDSSALSLPSVAILRNALWATRLGKARAKSPKVERTASICCSDRPARRSAWG